jgi:hypothetical protein
MQWELSWGDWLTDWSDWLIDRLIGAISFVVTFRLMVIGLIDRLIGAISFVVTFRLMVIGLTDGLIRAISVGHRIQADGDWLGLMDRLIDWLHASRLDTTEQRDAGSSGWMDGMSEWVRVMMIDWDWLINRSGWWMDGWIDGWIGYMLSRGLKPRCRSEYLGQLDGWSESWWELWWLPPHAPPLAAAERRDSGITQHTQACWGWIMQHRQHMMSAAAHTLVWSVRCNWTTRCEVCVVLGLVIRCDVMGWGRGENSRVNQYKSAFVVVQIYEHERNLRRS